MLPQRARLRHIPGPAPLWGVGHILLAKRHGLFLFEMWRGMGAKYGKVFKWFWAAQPVITIRGAKERGWAGLLLLAALPGGACVADAHTHDTGAYGNAPTHNPDQNSTNPNPQPPTNQKQTPSWRGWCS
jgi:hypothetical protein